MIKKYNVLKTYNHLLQIQLNHEETHRLYGYDSIRQKLIYLKYTFSNVSFIEIVTIEPNFYEGS